MKALSQLGFPVYLVTKKSDLPSNEKNDLPFLSGVSCVELTRIRRRIVSNPRYSDRSASPKNSDSRKETKLKRSPLFGLKRFMKSFLLSKYRFNYDAVENAYYVLSSKRFFKVAVNVAKKCTKIDADNRIVFFTSVKPEFLNEVGSRLKRTFPSSIWISDYRDPIQRSAYGKCTKSSLIADELALSSADVITSVSQGYIESIAHSALSMGYNIVEKTLVMPSCLDSTDSQIPRPTRSLNHEAKAAIVYTGTIYGTRSLEPVLEAIRIYNLHNEYEVVYAGKNGREVDFMASRYSSYQFIRNLGFVSRERVEELYQESDLLLLLKSHTSEQGNYPGKIFEYLKQNKPILVIGDEDLEFNDFASQCGGIYVVPYNVDAIGKALTDLRSSTIEISRNNEFLSSYSWVTQAQRLLNFVRDKFP